MGITCFSAFVGGNKTSERLGGIMPAVTKGFSCRRGSDGAGWLGSLTSSTLFCNILHVNCIPLFIYVFLHRHCVSVASVIALSHQEPVVVDILSYPQQ